MELRVKHPAPWYRFIQDVLIAVVIPIGISRSVKAIINTPFSFAIEKAFLGSNIGSNNSGLKCTDDRFQYRIKGGTDNNHTVRVYIQGKDGEFNRVLNDSYCGVWLSMDFDGSLVLEADYEGCYVEMDMDYTVVVMLKQNVNGQWDAYHKEKLRCPLTNGVVMDAPSPSVCINVQRADRLPCAGPSQSQALCEKTGCCYDQSDPRTPCYYGDKITASCTMDGQLSVAVSRDATLPPLILSTVRLLRGQGAGCTPVAQNDVFLLFMFPLSTCGTTVAENGAFMVYENDLVAEKDIRSWRGASISRDSTFRLHIRCSVSASDHLPISAEVFTLPPPSPASSQGPVSLEMRIATDSSYGQYYGDGDYPIVKVLRDPLFVEVRVLNRNDPALTLVLNQCWATTSSNPLLELQWPILVDRCPFDGDNYRTQLVSIEGSARLDFPSHYQRFIVNTFVFVDSMSQQPLGGLVYFHCSASLCLPSSFDSCLAACRSRHVDHFTHTMDWTRVAVAVLS
ncbi:zona pellucida sperm-binding protein 4-like [Spea bombifrons]|uniref:zona pellucida sperm-binding protein 4-like n=1 Tax=Spea bombifrons TaxID=233779 RepID=UPI00234A4565|nr:zona pellucida sperm-binding protein 4-like [Spea bombifrons]